MKTIYQIYTYDRQLLKFYNREHNIEGFYDDRTEAQKDFIRASCHSYYQVVLVALDKYSSKIVGVAQGGVVTWV